MLGGVGVVGAHRHIGNDRRARNDEQRRQGMVRKAEAFNRWALIVVGLGCPAGAAFSRECPKAGRFLTTNDAVIALRLGAAGRRRVMINRTTVVSLDARRGGRVASVDEMTAERAVRGVLPRFAKSGLRD